MKRKRFIKLSMAHGNSRDQARRAANYIAWKNQADASVNKVEKESGRMYRLPMLGYQHFARWFGYIAPSEREAQHE